MEDFPDLRRVQELFWQLVTAPEGAAAGAAALCRAGELASEDLSFLVRDAGRLGPVERVDVYANMYFYRLRDSLAEDFPRLARRIGAARFHNLVTDYLLAHPSRHFSLRELGRALPGFLDAHVLAEAFPALADLARLEWARLEVFDAAPARPLTRAELLARAGAAGPAGVALRLVPAARLLRLDASVPDLWKSLDPAQAAALAGAGAPRGARGVLVWRRGFAVLHRPLAPDEEAALRRLAGGVSLAGLGESLLEDGADADRTPERLAALLEQWTRDELLGELGGSGPV